MEDLVVAAPRAQRELTLVELHATSERCQEVAARDSRCEVAAGLVAHPREQRVTAGEV